MDSFRKEVSEGLLITLYKMSIIELKNAQADKLIQQNPHRQASRYPKETQLSFSIKERALLKLLIGKIPNPETELIYPVYLDLYKRVILDTLISPTIGAFTSEKSFMVSDIKQLGFRNHNGGKIFLLTNLGSTYLSEKSEIYKSLSKDIFNKILLDMWVGFSRIPATQTQQTQQNKQGQQQPQQTQQTVQSNIPIEAQVPYGTPIVYDEMLKAGLFPIYKFENIIGYTIALYLLGSAIIENEVPDIIKDFIEHHKIEPRNWKLLVELGELLETTATSEHVIEKSDDLTDPEYSRNYFGKSIECYPYLEETKSLYNLGDTDFCLLFTYKDAPPEYVFNFSSKTENLLNQCFGNKINPSNSDLVVLASNGLLTPINT